MNENLTAERALSVWGAEQNRHRDSALFPDGLGNDHTRGHSDESASIAAYVESTDGFYAVQLVLTLVYVRRQHVEGCRRLDDFREELAARLADTFTTWQAPEALDAMAGVEVSRHEKEIPIHLGKRPYRPAPVWKWSKAK